MTSVTFDAVVERARGGASGMPPSRRRRYVGYVMEAKRDQTRARRVRDSIDRIVAWAEARRR